MNNRYSLMVNGQVHETDAEPIRSLLDVLRENLRLTGSKKGCDEAECGSCTVLVDGKPMLACIVMIADVRDREILTIEGLNLGEELHPIQAEMASGGGIQCGYCTPGIIMSAYALLQENSNPTRDEIRSAISGNICRCTGYVKILDAVQAAASKIK